MIIYTDKPGDYPVLYSLLATTGLPWSTDLRVIGTLSETPNGLAPSAAVGYTNWVGDSVFMHMASRDKIAGKRDLLREAFVYPFITCGKRVVYGMTPITNEEAIRFSTKVGFREVFRDSNFVLLQMTFKECRWLNVRKQSAPGTGLRSSG